MPDYNELGRIGFNAYSEKADWKNYEGNPIPQWPDLPQHIRDKWAVATEAIAVQVDPAIATPDTPKAG